MQKAAGLSPFLRLVDFVRASRPIRAAHAYEREVMLIASVGLATFYWTALSSYSPLDGSPVAVAVPALAPANLAGTVGASLSGLALFVFGAVAWTLPLPVLATALLVARRRAGAVARSRVIGWVVALSCLAAVIALKHPYVTWRGFDFPAGGLVGTVLAGRLLVWFGKVGAFIAVGTLALCAPLLILRQALLEPLVVWGRKKSSEGTIRKPLWWDTILHRSQPKEAPEEPSVAEFRAPLPLVMVDAPSRAEVQAPAEVFEEDEDGVPIEPVLEDINHPAVIVEKLHSPAYARPPISVFNQTTAAGSLAPNQKDLETTAALLVKTFEDFGVQGKIIGYQPGPVVTVFEFQPDAGVKQSKVVGLIDDLALALKVDSLFIHPVRGKRALGVQVPNPRREPVHLGDILATPAFNDAGSPLTFGMGKTINGQPMCADLTAMPHLLVAGATGSGKSVCVNGMLCSIIMKAAPEDVRMILVDPKMLELSVYEGIPHLLMPVITEPAKASLALKWAVVEMERRYKLMQLACVRNIGGFNELLGKASNARKAELAAAAGEGALTRLPYIVLVIDELADLMMTAPKDVESSIQRLAQKARASGIHMVLATQRPSVDIITGVIKANLPCRIAFQVVSKHDSRTILDLIGAEKLLGKGDMLLQRPGAGRLERLQGALITDEEVLNLVATVKAQGAVHYDESIICWIDDEFARQASGEDDQGPDVAMNDDENWDKALDLARTKGMVSASFLQRHLKIGYNRAARIVEFMESQGLVSKPDGAKPRKWLGNTGN